MTTTYNTATDIGKVRLNIQDTDTDDAYFTNEEIQVFLTAGGSVLEASARALEALASSKALLARSVKTLNYAKDTRGVADGLLKAAAVLRKQDAETAAVGIVELPTTDANYTIIVGKEG